MSSARPATTTPSRASSGAASRSVRSVVSRRRDHASATGSSDAGTPPSPARRRRRGGDGDENSRRGAGNISGRTSRGLTNLTVLSVPAEPRDGPERTSPSVPAPAAPYRSRVRRGARRRRARTPVRRRGGSPRPGAVPRRVPVGPEPRRPITATAGATSPTPIPPNSAVTRNPSLQAGPASPASVTVRTTPVSTGTESAIETPTYEVRSRPFGGRAEQFPEALGGEKRGAQSRGDEAGKEEQRERPQPADDRVHDGRGGRDSGERGEGEGHTRTDFAPDKRFVVVRASPAPRFDGSPR